MNIELIVSQLKNHKDKYYCIAFSYLKNEQDALDAIQELSYKSIKHHKKIKSKDYLDAFLTRILVNHCLDHLRKTKRDQQYFEQICHEAEASHIEDLELGIYFSTALQRIKPKYQEVIILKYFEGLKTNEIAKALNRSENTIKTWLKRGLAELKADYFKGGATHEPSKSY